MTSHACRAPKCPVIVGYQMLMCARHWRMVPPEIQRRVWKEWREVCTNSGELHPAYVKAVDDAVAFVKGK